MKKMDFFLFYLEKSIYFARLSCGLAPFLLVNKWQTLENENIIREYYKLFIINLNFFV